VLPIKDNVPTRAFPVVTVGLIVANVIVWLWEWTGTSADVDIAKYAYYPCSVQGPCVGTAAVDFRQLPWYESAFTSMFMHGSWVHIGGNMLFLWIFGNNVEDALGRVRFFVWYVAAGLAATALQTFITLKFSGAPGASVPNVGASGAISGVLGAYLLLLPSASVLTVIFLGFFFFLQEVPALLFLVIWFGFQLLDGGFALVHPEQGGGVAFFAHVGGFVFGMLTVFLVARRRPLRPSW
jgi:membrane associated rhomboid family serine protease